MVPTEDGGTEDWRKRLVKEGIRGVTDRGRVVSHKIN